MLKRIIMLSLGLFVFMVNLSAQEGSGCQCTNCPQFMPDNFVGDFNLNVIGGTNDDLSNPSQGVCGVNLLFDHQYLGDLQITLTSPAGQEITLVGPIGLFGDTDLSTWDVSFVPCGGTAVPDFGQPSTWNNTFMLGPNTDWEGSYYPNSGCLEDFDTGPINGTWTLTVFDGQAQDVGTFLDFEIIFCDDTGINCNSNPCGVFASVDYESIFCSGETVIIDASASTGNTFEWETDDGEIVGSTNGPIIEAVSGGTYYVTVSDNGSCEEVAIAILTEIPEVPEVVITQDVPLGCNNTTVVLNGENTEYEGVFYNWFEGDESEVDFATAIPIGTGATLTVTEPGTYTLGIVNIDAACVGFGTYTVVDDSEYPEATAQVSAMLDCVNTTVELQGDSDSNFNTFEWSGPDGFMEGIANPVVSVGGEYILVVTNDSGCTATASIVVDVNNEEPIADAGPSGTIDCSAGSSHVLDASASTGGGTLEFEWILDDNGTNTSVASGASPTFETNQPGDYTVIVTDVTNGCTSTAMTSIMFDPQFPEITVVPSDPFIDCNNPIVQVNSIIMNVLPTDDLTFSWVDTSTDTEIAPTQSFTATSGGTYNLIVTNNTNGCSAESGPVTIIDNRTPPTVDAGLDMTIDCVTTSVDLTGTATGGANLSYAWTDSSGGNVGNTATVTVSNSDTYTLTVIDNDNGCSETASVTVTEDIATPENVMADDGVITCTSGSFTLNGSTTSTDVSVGWTGPNDFMSNESNPTVSSAGTYTFIVTNNGNGCTATATAEVINDSSIPNGPTFNTDVSVAILNCNQPSFGLNGMHEDSSVTLAWTLPDDSVNNNTSITVTQAGTYVLVATATNGCTSASQITVNENVGLPTIESITGGTIDCANSTIDLALSTPDNVDYNWSGPGLFSPPSDPTPTVNTAGTYAVTITSTLNGCSAEGSIEVMEDAQEPDVSVASQTGTVINCNEPNLILEATSSVAGVEYTWPNGEENASISIDMNGVYEVTVTNPANSCTSTDVITIDIDNTAPTATANGQTITCLVPDAQLSATTDATNATFEWSDDSGIYSNDQNPTTNVGGVYTLVVTNTDNGCTNQDAFQVLENNDNPVISSIMGGEIDCLNPTVIVEGVSETAGVDFLWTGPGINAGIETVANPEVGEAGTYILTITNPDNGCTATDMVEVTIDANIPVASATGGIINCYNQDTGVALMGTSSVEGVNYEWSGPNGFNSMEQNPIALDVGDYTLTITDSTNGCSVMASTTVDDDTAPPTDISATGGEVDCTQTTTQLMATSLDSDVNYLWSGGDIDASNEAEQNPTVSQIGTYTLTVTSNANGCTASTTANVTTTADLPDAQAGAVGIGILSCANEADGVQIMVTTNVQNASFTWLYPDGITTSTEQMPIVFQAGTYDVVVTNEDTGCTNSTDVTIADDFDEPGVMSEDASINCENPTVELMASSPTGGSNFDWTGPGINATNSFDSTPTVDVGGDYTLVVSGPNSCTSSITITVAEDLEEPAAAVVTDALTITCSEVEVLLDGTGSADTGDIAYQWSDASNVAISTELSHMVNTTGTYTLLVTNNENGCTNTAMVNVDDNLDPPMADAGADGVFACQTTELTLDASASLGQGDLSYEWVDLTNTPMATITGPGTYQLIVTDAANGCTDEDEVLIEPDLDAPTPDVTSTNILTCVETASTLDASGSSSVGGGNLTYEWTFDGNVIGNMASMDVSDAGTYTLQITDDSNGCVASLPYELTEDIAPPTVVIALPNTLTCEEVAVTLDGSGSDIGTYEWTAGTGGNILMGETTNSPNVDEPGIYTLQVTNTVNGCTNTESVTVVEDADFPDAEITVVDEFTCSQEEVNLNNTGSSQGTNYTYDWNGPGIVSSVTGESVVIGSEGTYQLIVTNLTTGCSETAYADVPPNTNMIAEATASINDESCISSSDGLISIEEVVGGTPPYMYALDGGFLGQTPVFTALAPGSYNLLIQDAEGCEFALPIDILPGIDLALELGADQTIDLGDSVTINPQVSHDYDTIVWNNILVEGNNPTIHPTNTLTYVATVTDENGCMDTDNITIFVERNRNVFIPTAFSPGDDSGINDIFFIHSDDSVEEVMSFRVFDRWGTMVYSADNFQTNDNQYGWDGTHGGKLMTPAVFVYYAEIKFKDGLVEIFKGDVTLMR